VASSILQRLIEVEKERLNGQPGSVQDLIYRWNIEDFIKYANKPCGARTCVSVSDLVYCSMKYYYKRVYPEITLAENLYAAWASYGRLVHRGLQDLLKEHGFKVEYEVEKLVELEVNGDKRIVGVHGRLDALGSLNNRLTVVEIKSSRSDVDLPKPQHILQLRIYMYMAHAAQGILVYITPDRIAEYAIYEPLSPENIKLLLRETLENTKRPRYDWECSYCPFSIMCPYKQTNNRFHKR